MLSFAQLAQSPVVLGPVIDQLNLSMTPKQLSDAMTVTTPQNTVILQVGVTDPDPQHAADIANAIASSLAKTVEQIAPKTAQGSTTVSVRVIQNATVPADPSSPNTRLNLVTGLLLGLVLGALFVILRAALDTRVHNAEIAAAVTNAPLLGSIQRERGKRVLPVLATDPRGVSSENYRQLRSNLEFVTLDSATRGIVVTSSIPGEGKSMIACNLALALAETGQKVLLVDADLRRPMVASYSGLVGEAGLTSVLVGRAEFADVVQRWGSGGPDVLTSGPIPPNPSELLSSRAMTALLDRLLAEFDVVVLDTPPLIAVADGAILGRQVDGAIVVVDRTRTRRQQLVQAVDSLEKSGVTMLGVVLNRVHAQKNRDVYYSTPKAPSRRFRVPTRSPAAEAPVAARPGAVEPVARVDRTAPHTESEQLAPDRAGRPTGNVAPEPGQSGAALRREPDHAGGRAQSFGAPHIDPDEAQGASTGPVSTSS